MKQVADVFGAGFEKLVFFIIASMMIVHIFACLWVFFCEMGSETDVTWIDGEVAKMQEIDPNLKELDGNKLYLTSFYFIITTFSTVGYGDISANNFSEKIFCIIVMCVGVTAFAAGTSTLTNLIQNYDTENKAMQEKIDVLNRIYKEYFLPLKLYENVKKSIKYQFQNDIDDIMKFVEGLPQDLRLEVTLFIFESTFK